MLTYKMYTKLIKWWLIVVIIILPLQYNIVLIAKLWNYELATYINRLDELTIGVFFPIALIELFREKVINKRSFIILLSFIMAIFFCGLISGLLNHNAFLATIHGSIDYIKYYIVIFIYAAFFKSHDEYKKIFRVVTIITILICFIAIVQETWAVYYKYVLNVSANKIPYLELRSYIPLEKSLFQSGDWQWRNGIYRVSSLMVNHTSLGMYCLFVFTIYSSVIHKYDTKVFLFLLAGIFLSVSRLVYGNFIIILSYLIVKRNRWLALLIIPFVLFLFGLASLDDFKVDRLIGSLIKSEYNDRESENTRKRVISYREYTRNKAVEIWKESPIWGVGPSMYGGGLSVKYNSPYYNYSHNFMPIVASYVKQWGSIDQFWPQVLAELGIVGIVLFTFFFTSLFATLFVFKKGQAPELNKLLDGLIMYLIVILISTTVLSLNLTSTLFSYFAFVGIAFGYILRSDNI